MSGRIRTLKPEILEDERTAHLSHAGYRLFIGLILVADDYGNFRANPDQLRGAIFWGAPPDDPRTSEAGGIDALLAELAAPEDDGSPGLITLYRVKGQRYGHLNGWSKNQRVQKPGAPRVPGPKEGENAGVVADSGGPPESFRTHSGAGTVVPTPDLRSPITINERGRALSRESQPIQAPIPIPQPISPSSELSTEMHEYAAMQGLADIKICWEKFLGLSAERGKRTSDLFGSWKRFVADEVRYQRRDRDRAAERGEPAEPKKQAARQIFRGHQ